MNLHRAVFVLLAGMTVLVSGCSTTLDTTEGNDKDTNRFASYVEGDYRIGVDDRLQITVWRNPELSVTVPVRPDGKISAPLIGDIQAGGNTPTPGAGIINEKVVAYI